MDELAAEARAVVTELRKRVTARRARWQPRPLPAPPARDPMTADPALEYLHGHWALPDGPASPPPGPLWKRLAWRVAGRFVFGTLTSYLHQERELLSRVVQVCDTLAKRVDTLQADIEQLALATSRQLAELAPYLPEPDTTAHESTGTDTVTSTSTGTDTDAKAEPGDAVTPGSAGPPRRRASSVQPTRATRSAAPTRSARGSRSTKATGSEPAPGPEQSPEPGRRERDEADQ